MVDMARKEILPAVIRYCGDLSESVNARLKSCPGLPCKCESRLIHKLSELVDGIDEAIDVLAASIDEMEGKEITEQAFHIRDILLNRMAELRTLCDEAETLTAASYWPFPTYGDLLFGV